MQMSFVVTVERFNVNFQYEFNRIVIWLIDISYVRLYSTEGVGLSSSEHRSYVGGFIMVANVACDEDAIFDTRKCVGCVGLSSFCGNWQCDVGDLSRVGSNFSWRSIRDRCVCCFIKIIFIC